MRGSPRSRSLAGALLAGVTLAACSGDSPTTPGAGPSTVRVQITNSSAPAGLRARLAKVAGGMAMAAAGVGEAAPEHLEYFLTSLMLCQDVTTNGTAYTNTQGCIELYGNRRWTTTPMGTPRPGRTIRRGITST